MKRCSFLLMLFSLIFVFGCQTNKTRVAEGAGIGGAVGALAGGIIGHQSGHGWEGALIGGAAGATTGAVVGAQVKKEPQAREQENLAQKLTLSQIVEMTKQKVSADYIINRIKETGTKLVLTGEDIAYLQKEGVSQRVIEAVQGL